MQSLVDWNRKLAAITTATFKEIKDYVLKLNADARKLILTSTELRARLQRGTKRRKFSKDEMITAWAI